MRNVKVWDGRSFTLMTKEKADKLVAKGHHQNATLMNCNDLKSYAQLNPPRKRKKAYETREMRADADGNTTDRSQPADLSA